MGRRILAAGVACAALFATSAGADIVLIDTSDPAYAVFARLPQDKEESVRRMTAGQPGATVLSQEEFAAAPEKHVLPRARRDDYAGQRAGEGIVALVQKYPGTPFGFTWNGGIAVTRNDYAHARRLYEAYNRDPAEYEKLKPADARADPLHPAAHLGPLLGW